VFPYRMHITHAYHKFRILFFLRSNRVCRAISHSRVRGHGK